MKAVELSPLSQPLFLRQTSWNLPDPFTNFSLELPPSIPSSKHDGAFILQPKGLITSISDGWDDSLNSSPLNTSIKNSYKDPFLMEDIPRPSRPWGLSPSTQIIEVQLPVSKPLNECWDLKAQNLYESFVLEEKLYPYMNPSTIPIHDLFAPQIQFASICSPIRYSSGFMEMYPISNPRLMILAHNLVQIVLLLGEPRIPELYYIQKEVLPQLRSPEHVTINPHYIVPTGNTGYSCLPFLFQSYRQYLSEAIIDSIIRFLLE